MNITVAISGKVVLQFSSKRKTFDNQLKANQFRLLLILEKSDLLKSIFEMDTISEELIIVASFFIWL